jgi:ubiquinone/menaquinone biosynthesis C-methylase UbiE
MPSELARALVDKFAPTGDVLELACGNGSFTRELVRHARTVTGVDGSPRMLERNRSASVSLSLGEPGLASAGIASTSADATLQKNRSPHDG